MKILAPVGERLTTSGGISFRGCWAIFWVALGVRVVYMTLAHTYRFRPYEDHFDFGWEMARVARSLVLGHGYSDPFITGGTGPTAWLPPAYPLVIAAVFKLFGPYTQLSGWTMLTQTKARCGGLLSAFIHLRDQCF